MTTGLLKFIGLEILLLVFSGCLKEENCDGFLHFLEDGAGEYTWVQSIFYTGTDSMFVLDAAGSGMHYQFIANYKDAAIYSEIETYVMLKRNGETILRFVPICSEFDHLIDPETGNIMDGFKYWYNAQGERLEIKWFGDLDHPWLRYPYSNAINIYERVD
jgi:hypothetical protein